MNLLCSGATEHRWGTWGQAHVLWVSTPGRNIESGRDSSAAWRSRGSALWATAGTPPCRLSPGGPNRTQSGKLPQLHHHHTAGSESGVSFISLIYSSLLITFRVIRGWFGFRLRASHSSSVSISMLKSLGLSLDRPEPRLPNTHSQDAFMCLCTCERQRQTDIRMNTCLTSLLCPQTDAEPPPSSLSSLSPRPDSVPAQAAWTHEWENPRAQTICDRLRISHRTTEKQALDSSPLSELTDFSRLSGDGVAAPLLGSSRCNLSVDWPLVVNTQIAGKQKGQKT